MKRSDAPLSETFAPARNFSITLSERVSAAGGPRAYMVRRRSIEDLEAEIIAALRTLDARAVDPDDDVAARLGGRRMRRVHSQLLQLNRLIEDHNRYYPTEANLPLDPATGAMLERGRPWSPLPVATLASLRARAGASPGDEAST